MLPIRSTRHGDMERILALASKTGVFTPQEVVVVKELMEIELNSRDQKDYHSFVAEVAGQVVGFACYGPTPMTDGTYDLYWILVDPSYHHRGIGGALLQEVEKSIRGAKGRMLLADTSSSRPYLPARRFYQNHGFRKAAKVEDYYSPGDSRLTYVKQFL